MALSGFNEAALASLTLAIALLMGLLGGKAVAQFGLRAPVGHRRIDTDATLAKAEAHILLDEMLALSVLDAMDWGRD